MRVIAGLFRRAGRRGHAVGGRGDAAGVHPPARAGREALRGRADRDHRRAGIARRARQRDRRRHRRQARACEHAGGAAGADRRGLPDARPSRPRTMPLDQPQPADEEDLGGAGARAEPERDRRAARTSTWPSATSRSRGRGTCRSIDLFATATSSMPTPRRSTTASRSGRRGPDRRTPSACRSSSRSSAAA